MELSEFGFDYEMCYFALKISSGDREQAVELLVSGGADIDALRILAQSAKIIPEVKSGDQHLEEFINNDRE